MDNAAKSLMAKSFASTLSETDRATTLPIHILITVFAKMLWPCLSQTRWERPMDNAAKSLMAKSFASTLSETDRATTLPRHSLITVFAKNVVALSVSDKVGKTNG
jgi:peptidoglycan biosynthesis protein MviN/MurJ (putative lipid II flippase)